MYQHLVPSTKSRPKKSLPRDQHPHDTHDMHAREQTAEEMSPRERSGLVHATRRRICRFTPVWFKRIRSRT
jgi:hypothetical protein